MENQNQKYRDLGEKLRVYLKQKPKTNWKPYPEMQCDGVTVTGDTISIDFNDGSGNLISAKYNEFMEKNNLKESDLN